ncbi:cytochrome P450 family protein [Nocardia crassostreae]|uniref:cytochrome P450 family protein n=1 Tax=Nocardia crassostreae TaxID=53428 RepID=UPI0008342C9F|nr:cytochrome P450 [Nocardia crassostreae]
MTASSAPFDNAYLAGPHAVHRRLREEGAVRRVELPGGAAAWFVTREADVRQGLADPRLSIDKRAARDGYVGFSLPPALDANLLNIDPPDHTRLRRLVSHAFTRGRIAGLGRRIQEEADRLLDKMAGCERVDLIAEFAAPLPMTVIGDLLGIPEADRGRFRGWTEALLAPDPNRPQEAKLAVVAMEKFLLELIEDKRAMPSDDFLSDLIAVRDDGSDRLTEDELVSLAFLTFWAGYQNSVDLIGNGLLALLDNPDQLAALRSSAEVSNEAIEELLRYAHPSQFGIRRFPLEDITIGGVDIPAGETVLLGVASANRDPHRFTDPERLDLSRAENPHLALGHGVHYCLGAPLARLEARIAIRSVLDRFPSIELAIPRGEVRWRSSFREHGLRELPVTVGQDSAATTARATTT